MYKPEHPRANSEGYVYTHMLQAERKLGRPLNADEVVHHIDENKLNNAVENLMVFVSASDHVAYHQHKEDKYLVYNKDGSVSYPYRYSRKTFSVCPICGSQKACYAKLCKQCYNIARRMPTPDRQQLKELIRTMPFTTIAKQFGVSDNAVRKWCKRYSLPSHTREIRSIPIDAWSCL